MSILDRILGGLIVSCQAPDDSPLRDSSIMAAMAIAAEHGGALGIRAQGEDDIAAIDRATDLPIIGLMKRPPLRHERVYITPGFADAVLLAVAGSDIIALDGTNRPRDGGMHLSELIERIHSELNLAVMADIDSPASAVFAEQCGADLIGTTLVGYTVPKESGQADTIDLASVATIAAATRLPILAEGRIWSREDAIAAMNAGACGVVVGSSITNPVLSTRRFAEGLAGLR